MAAIPDYVLGNIIVTEFAGAGQRPEPAKEEGFDFCRGEDRDDLLTAGLLVDQLREKFDTALIANPKCPTTAELRRLAIHYNYQSLIDVTKEGGFGDLFGKHITGKHYGREYLALARAAPDDVTISLMALIPDNLDTANPFIVTAPASGSRGIYGAISMAEWPLAKGFVVAATDRGGGPGLHDFDRDTVYTVDGVNKPAVEAGDGALFHVADSPDMQAFKAAFPHRLGVKHAHSGTNPERYWGRHVLLSIRFALFCLNHARGSADGTAFTRANTRVIATGVSNGGGAALRAAEQDEENLIDGVVVSEPQVQPQKLAPQDDFAIKDRGRVLTDHSRTLLDAATLMDVYAPAALLAIENGNPSDEAQQPRVRHCRKLHELGLLKADDPMAQSKEALEFIYAAGFLRDADKLHWFHQAICRQLAMQYANAYGRASASDHVCGVSAAAVDENRQPKQASPELAAQAWAWGGGFGFLSPYGNVAYVETVPQPDPLPNFGLPTSLCFRSVFTGRSYQGQTAVGVEDLSHRALAGNEEVRATGKLRGKPTLILHGRSDALVAPNHSSRPYYALNKTRDGADSPTRYLEIVGGNHFDFFIPRFGPMSGPDWLEPQQYLVPMHYYVDQALDLMHAHLTAGDALPDSQVVPTKRTKLELDPADLPHIEITAPAGNRIVFDDGELRIPKGEF